MYYPNQRVWLVAFLAPLLTCLICYILFINLHKLLCYNSSLTFANSVIINLKYRHNTLYAAKTSGLYSSHDNSHTWQAVWGAEVIDLGQIEMVAPDRLFDVPAELDWLVQETLDEKVTLLGANVTELGTADPLALELIWRADDMWSYHLVIPVIPVHQLSPSALSTTQRFPRLPFEKPKSLYQSIKVQYGC